MHTLWYTAPSGDHLPNPTAEQMLGWMRDETYWGPYSPVATLWWHEHSRQKVLTQVGLGSKTWREQLIAVRHPKRGWYFEYSTSNLPTKRWLVPFDPSADPDSFVTGWAFGEQSHFLRGCFVQQAVAERIVTGFVASRKPSRAVRWVSFNRVRPRLDSDGYRERRQEVRAKSQPAKVKAKRHPSS